MRTTSLSLDEIKAFSPLQFQELYDEVSYQEAVKSYETAMYIANLLAAIANTIPRKGGRGYKADDFLKIEPPQRRKLTTDKEDFEGMTKQVGIKLPSK